MSEEQLFDLALPLSPADRAAMLERECAGNPVLRARVEALLAADAESKAIVDSQINQTASYTGTNEAVGAFIAGKYKLVELIGEGGMGSVWCAEQSEPIRRHVALKLIKAGMDSKQVIARFEVERQALAVMDHPNIAKVLDGGLHESRPYFVMELVKGVPITQYCDAKKLTPKERLELFVPVCQAIQHAHQKGIIHRDIKPSNVLIAPYDDKPVPKVIDFGLAKATGVSLTDASQVTNFGGVVGTPQYMSPEQASLNNLDIDTRSDIYSLGVLLYELLSGSPPFAQKELEKAGMLEMLRVIREEEPPKPSTKLSTADALPGISANRGTEPKKLTGLLRNELDWIVMKALEKDRVRRYETANGFAADINRFLAGEPVNAHPPSAGYRMQKFLRKHKGPAIASAAVAMALLVGIVGFAWQADIAQKERNVAQTERDRAIKAEGETKKRADELKTVSDFQAQMLGQVNPTTAGVKLREDLQKKYEAALVKDGVPEAERIEQVASFMRQLYRVNATDAARELIERTILKPAVAAIDNQFKDQPIVDASLRQVLANRYYDFGLYDAALPLQIRSLDLRRQLLGPDHPDTLASIKNMGSLLWAQAKLIQAESQFRDALEKCQRVLGDEHPETLTALYNMGHIMDAQDKQREAESYLREALGKRRRILGEQHPDTIASISTLGRCLFRWQKLEEAETIYREALEKSRIVFGDDHPQTLNIMTFTARVLESQGKLAESESLLQQTLEKARRVLGEGHPFVISPIVSLGSILYAQGRLTEAETFLREALEKRRQLFGEAHPTTLMSIINMAGLLQKQGNLAEAERYFGEAREKSRRTLGEQHPTTLASTTGLGQIYVDQGKYKQAIELLTPIEDAARKTMSGDWKLPFPYLLMSIGQAHLGVSQFGQAEVKLSDAYRVFVKVRGEQHEDTQECLSVIVHLYTAWHAAEPTQGHDVKAAEWKKKLETMKQVPTPKIKPAEKK